LLPFLIFFMLTGSLPCLAIQTNEVEIGRDSIYDGTVLIRRDAAGAMVFQDNQVSTPVALLSLVQSKGDHGELAGLTSDDHPQYLDETRHEAAHGAAQNSALPVAPDIAGNTTLGGHLGDADIHPNRTETVEITAPWRFVAPPLFWSAIHLSRDGGAGDASIFLEDGATDAEIRWSDSDNCFLLNRGLVVDAPATLESLSVEEDLTLQDGRLLIGSVTHGWDVSGAQVAWWKLDDNEADTTVLDAMAAHHGLLEGGNSAEDLSTTGRIGSAFALNGSSDYVQCEAGSSLLNGSGFAWSVWTRNSLGSGYYSILAASHTVSAKYPFCEIAVSGGLARVLLRDTDGNTDADVSSTGRSVNDGVWRHVVAVYDGSQLRLYVDGALVNSSDSAWSPKPSGVGGLIFGARQRPGYSPENYYAGSVDDARVFNRALTAVEVEGLYASGLAGREESAQPYALDVNGTAYVSNDLVCGGELLQVSDPGAKVGLRKPDNSVEALEQKAAKMKDAAAFYRLKSHLFETRIEQVRVPVEKELRRAPLYEDRLSSAGIQKIGVGWEIEGGTVLESRDILTTRPLAVSAPEILGFDASLLPGECVREIDGVRHVSLMSVAALLAWQAGVHEDRLAALEKRLKALEEK
jgi:hypothetical protein